MFAIAAGFNDGGNLLAAAASSRTIPPRAAYLIIVAFACLGPIVAGTGVARTTGAGIADFHATGVAPLLAAIVGALAAVVSAYIARVPTSLSVALFSAMIGALSAGPGLSAIHWAGVEKVSRVGSIVVGTTAGALAYRLVASVLSRVRRRTGEVIIDLQYATVAMLAIGYGANDLEKSAGLLAAGVASSTFSVPVWTLVAAVACFAMGMVLGGVRVAKTVGSKLFSIRPYHALSFQLAAATTVIGAALVGGPLSTTEATASAIVGVGAAVNPRQVHWQVAGHIVLAWAFTAPLAMASGAIAELAIKAVHW
jgi:PiT family inorganic phosphate transporter